MGKIGLALSGGGAKGAYEIGVWQALEELRILQYVDTIYGTSVGALNAALLETCGAEKAKDIWLNLRPKDFFFLDTEKDYADSTASKGNRNNNRLDAVYAFVAEAFRNNLAMRGSVEYAVSDVITAINAPANITASLAMTRLFQLGSRISIDKLSQLLTSFVENGLPFSQQKIYDLIEDKIDFKKMHRKVVALCKTSKLPGIIKSFPLCDYDDEHKKRILLAASALPGFYTGTKGVDINGVGYHDAGFKDEDNTPIKWMQSDGYNSIIAVWLTNSPKPKYIDAAGENCIHIIPSEDIGKFINGTIKVSQEKIKNDIQLGYEDTMKKKGELISMLCREKFGFRSDDQ